MSQIFQSKNPATGTVIWEGSLTSTEMLSKQIETAQRAFKTWSTTSLSERIQILRRYAEILIQEKEHLIGELSEETGKPRWESASELDASIQKIDISIQAYQERCKEKINTTGTIRSAVRYKPHGILAVYGPFNFPLHLPNGHIVPALLAGNCVIFKPSELTPRIAERMANCWQASGLPSGVLQLAQGDANTGKALAGQAGLSGILFTGSASTGLLLHRLFSSDPGKMLALEMGGNNPLVIHDLNNIKAACQHVIVSAFITSGQRCSCARRLIVVDTPDNRDFINHLSAMTKKLAIGPYTKIPEPFMGPVISISAANRIKMAYEGLINAGAKPIIPLQYTEPAFIHPTIIDVTGIGNIPDEEIFGPVLQLHWVPNLDEAISAANHTNFGLSAGIFTANQERYTQFFQQSHAGIVNWNRPLTGASSLAPFGGIRNSGNHRPSAYFAADYCAYPVASQEESHLQPLSTPLPGMPL
jgi:succinylglutamic semialdehyde dehydrogenase